MTVSDHDLFSYDDRLNVDDGQICDQKPSEMWQCQKTGMQHLAPKFPVYILISDPEMQKIKLPYYKNQLVLFRCLKHQLYEYTLRIWNSNCIYIIDAYTNVYCNLQLKIIHSSSSWLREFRRHKDSRASLFLILNDSGTWAKTSW